MAKGQRGRGRNGSGSDSGFVEDDRPAGGASGFADPGDEDACAPPPEVPGVGHNGRSKSLSDALAKWCALQKQEDDLIAKYIDPVRKKKNKVKADVKSEFEIPTKAFNARAALRMIELEDDDEVVLAVNELFAVTPVGENVDLVVLAERVAKKAAEKAAEKAKGKNTEAEA